MEPRGCGICSSRKTVAYEYTTIRKPEKEAKPRIQWLRAGYMNSAYFHYGCVWIPLILLKTENLLLKKKKKKLFTLPNAIHLP